MQASAGNMTNFTGVLVKRHYKPGQKYIQLVFETAEGIHLSLSRNLRMVRSLSIGRTYNVRGQEYSLGQKIYIHEPVATPILAKTKSSNKRLHLVVASMIIVSLAGASVAALAITHDSAQPGIKKAAQTHKEASISSAGTASPTTDNKPAPTAPAATTTPVKKVISSSRPSKTATQATPAAIASSSQQQDNSMPSTDTPTTPTEQQAPPQSPADETPANNDPPQDPLPPADPPTETP